MRERAARGPRTDPDRPRRSKPTHGLVQRGDLRAPSCAALLRDDAWLDVSQLERSVLWKSVELHIDRSVGVDETDAERAPPAATIAFDQRVHGLSLSRV